MNSEEYESLLHNLLRYARHYRDPATVKRFLGIKGPVWDMLLEEAAWRGLIRAGDSLELTYAGQSALAKEPEPFFCPACQGTGLDVGALEPLATELARGRKKPDVALDQCPVHPQDLARRAAFIYEHGDLRGKRVLCLGDNDFTSLMLACLGGAKEIWVVDIDEIVLETIARLAEKHGFPVRIMRCDVRCYPKNEEEAASLEEFDTFIIDPPYTEKGFRAFATFGVRHLKRRGVAYAIMPYMRLERWSQELLFHALHFFLDLNFVVTDVHSFFQTYEHEDSIISALIRAERPGFVKEPSARWEEMNGKFYTSQN